MKKKASSLKSTLGIVQGVFLLTVSSIFHPGETEAQPPSIGYFVANPSVPINPRMSVGLAVSATGSTPLSYTWKFNGVPIVSDVPGFGFNYITTSTSGPSQSSLTINSFSQLRSGTYSVEVSNLDGIVSASKWVYTPYGAITGWGTNTSGSTVPPVGLDGVTAISAGTFHTLAVSNGCVFAWGDNSQGQSSVSPLAKSGVVSVAAGSYHSLALKSDGTVVGWGSNLYGETTTAGLSGIVAIGAGVNESIALKSDGTVVAWGLNTSGQTTVPAAASSGVVAIAGGSYHNLALKSNGTIVAWGNNVWGQCNVPANLSDVVAISAGAHHSIALTSTTGAVVAWGDNSKGQCNVPVGAQSGVWKIAAGFYHNLALKNDCKTVVAWGDDTYHQTEVPAQLDPYSIGFQSISAGLYQSLALSSCPELQYYPIDVSKDLLLIYNSNFPAGLSLVNYYLSQRQLVNSANVLNVPCDTALPQWARPYECITEANYASQVVAKIKGWLSDNPTKRPRYIVFFLGFPARIVHDDGTEIDYSLSYKLSQIDLTNSWADYFPLITHINMGDPLDNSGQSDLNVCYSYISKLSFFGTVYSPGRVVISASAGGYGNDDFYLDDNTGTAYPGMPEVSPASLALQSLGYGSTHIHYAPKNSSSITSGANVAGYMSWGEYNPAFLPNKYDYALSGQLTWTGSSDWYIMNTFESYNGTRRYHDTGQGNFLTWFSGCSFGDSNCSYAHTPVGGFSYVSEPGVLTGPLAGPHFLDPFVYMGLWASGRPFANCAWGNSWGLYPVFKILAVGDPLVAR